MTAADRQRRPRERSSHISGTGQNVLDQLNRAFGEGAARALAAGLDRVRSLKEHIDDPAFDAEWGSWETAFERITLACMSAEQWRQEARDLGAKLGEELVRIAERECLRSTRLAPQQPSLAPPPRDAGKHWHG